MLDAVRLGPDDDGTEVTAAQVRDVVTRLIEAGQHKRAEPGILIVFDAGYDVTRLAFLLADLSVELHAADILDLLARLRAEHNMTIILAPTTRRSPPEPNG